MGLWLLQLAVKILATLWLTLTVKIIPFLSLLIGF